MSNEKDFIDEFTKRVEDYQAKSDYKERYVYKKIKCEHFDVILEKESKTNYIKFKVLYDKSEIDNMSNIDFKTQITGVIHGEYKVIPIANKFVMFDFFDKEEGEDVYKIIIKALVNDETYSSLSNIGFQIILTGIKNYDKVAVIRQTHEYKI